MDDSYNYVQVENHLIVLELILAQYLNDIRVHFALLHATNIHFLLKHRRMSVLRHN